MGWQCTMCAAILAMTARSCTPPVPGVKSSKNMNRKDDVDEGRKAS